MQYAFRQNSDFDKYKALEMIESLKNAALDVRDKKADYFSTVHSKLLERITKPTEQFKSYVLSLLGDRDYEKVVEAVSKVDKAFTQETPVAPPIPPHQWFLMTLATQPPHIMVFPHLCIPPSGNLV